MIISSINSNQLKIILDKVDLINTGINPQNWISNSNNTLRYINNILKSNTNLLPKTILNDYYILTNNYNIFLIFLTTK